MSLVKRNSSTNKHTFAYFKNSKSLVALIFCNRGQVMPTSNFRMKAGHELIINVITTFTGSLSYNTWLFKKIWKNFLKKFSECRSEFEKIEKVINFAQKSTNFQKKIASEEFHYLSELKKDRRTHSVQCRHQKVFHLWWNGFEWICRTVRNCCFEPFLHCLQMWLPEPKQNRSVSHLNVIAVMEKWLG